MTLQELHERRIQAFRDHKWKSGEKPSASAQAVADSTSVDDWHMVTDAYRAQSDEVRLLIDLYSDIQREYAKGYRCGVCGMTGEQAAAIGNNCTYDC